MRSVSFFKPAAILLADFLIGYYTMGPEIALLVTAGIGLYGWIGEYFALFGAGAISSKSLREFDRVRLARIHNHLTADVRQLSGTDISRLKLHIIPSGEINAYAYGMRHVAVSRAMMDACDDMTLCGVLGHEISHTLNLDAMFNRLIFANVMLALVFLIVASFIGTSMLWIVFLILCGLGVCSGIVSMFVFRGVHGLFKGIFGVLQRLVVFVYRIVMGIVNRRCEYRADLYSCQLGYGPQLSYFLTRFDDDGDSRQKSLADILYASHPSSYKRIAHIEQFSTNTDRNLKHTTSSKRYIHS